MDGLCTTQGEYLGSVYTDVQFAVNHRDTDWCGIGHLALYSNVID